jgi:RNase H-fold protein (predicted Holliday junction resolvase)
MLLGLDISTSIIGVAVLDVYGDAIYNEAWNISNKNKYPSIFVKSINIKDRLINLSVNFPIDKIYIEKSLQSFRSGFSSAKTLSTLSSFNGVVSWLCYEVFKVEPEYVSASSARKLCGITVKRGQKAKNIVLKHLLDNEEKFVVEYTKYGNPKPKYYDMADSIIVAKAGHELCQNKKN